MGFWHTGYIEFHEQSGLHEHEAPRVVATPKPDYECEVCGAAFWSDDKLAHHRMEVHPRRRPQLFLRQMQAFEPLNIVSTPLAVKDVRVVHASRVTLDGNVIDHARLSARLSKMNQGVSDVILSDAGIDTRYRIKFEIANQRDLGEVDRAIFELASRHELTVDRIGDFVARCERYPTVRRYVDGLAQYLYGSLAKEQTGGTHIPYENYRERFNLALESLRGFRTSLSSVVVGLVNFSENVFDGYDLLDHAPRLQGAMQFFSQVLSGHGVPTLENPTESLGSSSARVPADAMTENLMGWAHELMRVRRLDDEALLRKMRQDPRTPPDDLFKLSILLAEHCLFEGRSEEAQNFARPYTDHPLFRQWAKAVYRADTK